MNSPPRKHTPAATAISESAELIKAAPAEADDLSLRHTLIQAVMLLATAKSESGKRDLARTTFKDALEIAKPL